MSQDSAVSLRLEGIEKSFGAVRALKGVTLEVAGGEVHVLVGENGAGKSTLMKVLSGAHQPDAGSVVLDGKEVRLDGPQAGREAQLDIGMVLREVEQPRRQPVQPARENDEELRATDLPPHRRDDRWKPIACRGHKEFSH